LIQLKKNENKFGHFGKHRLKSSELIRMEN